MSIVATRALTTVQIVRRSVMTVEQRGNTHLRQSRDQRETMTPACINKKSMGNSYPPYDERFRIPTLKGSLIDIYI